MKSESRVPENGLVVKNVVKHFHRKKPLSTDQKLRLRDQIRRLKRPKEFPQFLLDVLRVTIRDQIRRFNRPKESIKAVDGISFRVELGKIYGILGANGSGKSTLIRLISTLLIPDSGQITVFGYDVVKESFKVRQLINRVSVEASFFKKLSSEENLTYAARLYGIPAREIPEKAKHILNKLSFDPTRTGEGMEDLSRGMQQKVAIARALLTSPILLLLDEPTTGLDPKSKRDVQAFINEIRHEQDAIVLLTTHDMDEAEKLCDQIAIIDQGKFIAEGSVKELKRLVPKPEEQVSLEDVFIELTGKDLSEE